jgi:four helix bundle protein
MRDFRKLDIWNNSKDFAIEIYSITANFPDYEKFGLRSQINRSSVSIPSNIAEGCSRSSIKDLRRFIEIALGSSFELETQIIISYDLQFIDSDKFERAISRLHEIQKSISAYRNYLIKQQD